MMVAGFANADPAQDVWVRPTPTIDKRPMDIFCRRPQLQVCRSGDDGISGSLWGYV